MPLDEEGAKWSCEPCVRGHRSSKCQHFDRLMMKVPKAGRPLAKCPHPKGSCSCQKVYAFMVRIPKGSTCLCRPLYQVPAGSTEAAQTPGTPATASNSPAPGRIQKHSRRQSGLQAAPKNIAKALNSASELQTPASTSQSLPYSNFVQPHSSAQAFLASNQSFPTLLPKQTSNENESIKPSSGRCCSKRTEPVPPVQPGSCCSKSQPSAEGKNDGLEAQHVDFNPSWTETPYNASQVPSWTQSNQMGHYPSQNSNFAHPPIQDPTYTNGLITNPSSVPQMDYSLSANFDGNSFSNHVGVDQFFPNNTNGYPFIQPSMFAGDPTHECNCGDDCQCLGCATHPFNNTTRQHVQEMGYMMSSLAEEDENSESSTPFTGPMSPPTYPATASADVTSSNELQSHARQDCAENTSASTFDNVYSATASTDYTHQLMQPSEYYTLEYPVGLPGTCSNVTGTCQCGNDCSCIGCLTHSGHDGVTLEPAPAPDESAPVGDERPSHPSHDFSDYTSALRTLDEFSPSALSPPIIEAPLV
ncbi:hypothetical protein VTN77DRAFT_8855 [Rasamsonia byssochlamydoides]|uniref:uncharacterized protein n=1 Tax=Rasamsonia byssochlamydoides TaxID=89139 RepID=UPI003742148C